MAAIVYWQAGSWRQTLRFILFSLVVVLPFYYFAHFYTGNPFYSLAVHLDKLSQISGQSELAGFLMARSLTIPFSLVQLVVARDYISPVLISLVVPILWLGRRVIRLSQQLQILLFFAASQWVIWWLVPPLSTRYALSGFIVLILLLLKILQHLYDSQSQWRPVIQLVLAMSVLLTILPRLYVNYRGLRFLISGQPKAVYLEQFYDGWSDPKLQEWHQQPAGPT
jgi:hypothetical protein